MGLTLVMASSELCWCFLDEVRGVMWVYQLSPDIEDHTEISVGVWGSSDRVHCLFCGKIASWFWRLGKIVSDSVECASVALPRHCTHWVTQHSHSVSDSHSVACLSHCHGLPLPVALPWPACAWQGQPLGDLPCCSTWIDLPFDHSHMIEWPRQS